MDCNLNQYCGYLRATLTISRCHLLINFENSLDLDQEFFYKFNFEKKSKTIKAGKFNVCRKQS